MRTDFRPNLASAARAARAALGMTQVEAARKFRIPVATWRNWEQNRVRLDPAVKAFLTIVWRKPDVAKVFAEKKQG